MKKKLLFEVAVFIHNFFRSEIIKAQAKVYTAKANEIKAEIQPTMRGIFSKILTWEQMAEFMQDWLKVVRSSIIRH